MGPSGGVGRNGSARNRKRRKPARQGESTKGEVEAIQRVTEVVSRHTQQLHNLHYFHHCHNHNHIIPPHGNVVSFFFFHICLLQSRLPHPFVFPSCLAVKYKSERESQATVAAVSQTLMRPWFAFAFEMGAIGSLAYSSLQLRAVVLPS